MTEGVYIHGTSPEEQERLTALNRIMNQACLKELRLKGGERILDVGSGLAQFTRDMAREAGNPVIGVEQNGEQIQEALRQARASGEEWLLEMRSGDARALPLAQSEYETFDVAHARFVLEHVSEPQAVVQEMVRAVKPGGRIVLADDDHDVLRMWPEPAGFRTIWNAYMRTYLRSGADPYVGRRLVSLLHKAGAAPTRCTWVFFGGCAGESTFVPLVDNMIRILMGAQSAILAVHDDNEAFHLALQGLEAFKRRPDGALWFSICWAEGRRPDA